jgi:hypothetical protein
VITPSPTSLTSKQHPFVSILEDNLPKHFEQELTYMIRHRFWIATFSARPTELWHVKKAIKDIWTSAG